MCRAFEKAMEAMGGRIECVGTRESLRGTWCATQRGASGMDPCKRDDKGKGGSIFLFHNHRRDRRWVPPSDLVLPPPLHTQRPQKDRRKTAHETVLRRPLMDRRYTVHPEKGVSIRQGRKQRGASLPGRGPMAGLPSGRRRKGCAHAWPRCASWSARCVSSELHASLGGEGFP